ncbi:MAG: TonB-dependent siderophore receptor [Caulobacteraceae bacterium]|nr:TonB-dependent siderophore receptor [Caulobacteraceae bacterium]
MMVERNAARRGAGLSAATLALLMCGTAMAQTAPAQTAPAQTAPAQTAPTQAAPTQAAGGARAASGGPVLEEIVVTADRKKSFGADFVQAGTFRNARVIDTPLTVSVIPQELIQAQQAMTILDALRNSAGVTTSQINAAIYNNLAIRGIAVENRGNYRLNGALPVINLIDMPLEDKDRVEVLKGASALYYGFTTPAGIVNLTSKRPTAAPLTQVTLFGNSNGGIGGHIDFSRSWADGVYGLRLNAVESTVATGIDHTDGRRSLISGAFDWKPTDRFMVNLDAEKIYKTVSEPTEIQLPTSGAVIIPRLLDPKHNLGAKWMYGSGDEYNLLGHFQYNLSQAWNASFSVGQSHLERDRHYSYFQFSHMTPAGVASGAGTETVQLTNGNVYDNTMYRLELAGAFDTGPFDHQLVVGASDNIRNSFVPSNPSVTFADNYYNPVALPDTALPAQIIKNPTKIDDKGYYATDLIRYQSWLQLMIGVRKEDYSDTTFATVYSSKHSKYTTSPITQSYGVVVKPKSWVSLYATYIEGLEEGGIAPTTAVNASETLPAAMSKQKEAGVKIEPMRGFLITAAYFDINRASSYLNPSNVYVENGRADYKGVEFSATGEITRDLSVTVSALSLDAKQLDGAANVRGKLIENTAKDTESVFVLYRLPFLKGVSLSAGAFHVGSRAVNAINAAFVPGYTTYDLGASYATQIYHRATTFRVNAENVTNVRYWAATGSSLLAEGLPASVKFSVSTAF